MLGFGKKNAAKAKQQAVSDAATQFIDTVVAHVNEKMPAVCEWYIDLLITRVGEAQGALN